MKISTKGRYGLKAVIDIAKMQEKGAVALSGVAMRQNISDGYLEQLVAKLKKSGIVKSTRGAQGGYMLAKSPSEISVGDILRSLEGNLTPVDCPELEDGGICTGSTDCASKIVWKRINDSVNDAVDGLFLSDLL